MINAIQMAKCFCQNVNAYTRTAKTKQFIKLLETKALSEGNENIRFPIDSETNAKTAEKAAKDKVWLKTKRGAITQSWFCYPLALDFAAWLSPEFKLWVFDKIFV